MKEDKIIEELNKLLKQKETLQSNRDYAQLISLTEQIKILKWNLAMRICELR